MEIIENKEICKIYTTEYPIGKILEEFINCPFQNFLKLENILETISTINENKLRKEDKIREEISKYIPENLKTPIERQIYIDICYFMNGTATSPREIALEVGINKIKELQKKYIKKLNIITGNAKHQYSDINDVSNFLFSKESLPEVYYRLINLSNFEYEKHTYINNINQLVFYDFIRFLRNKDLVHFKKCPICSKVFVTTKGNSVYCDDISCKKKGKNFAYLNKLENDNYSKAYSKAYKRVHKQYVDSKYPFDKKESIFHSWKNSAKTMLNNIRKGNITEEEFFDYLKKENDPFRKK